MIGRAGSYDRRIAIQEKTVTYNADGQPIESWSNVALIWARIESQTATERFAAQQQYATVDTLFRVRWQEAITPTLTPQSNRILYRDRVYDLLGVVEIGRKVEAHLPTVGRAQEGTP